MKNTTRIVAGALLIGMAATSGAWAQGAPAPTQPAAPAPVVTEARRREARALGEKLGWEAQVRGIINTLRTAIIVNVAQVNGKQPQEMIAVVDDLLMPDFVGDAGEGAVGAVQLNVGHQALGHIAMRAHVGHVLVERLVAVGALVLMPRRVLVMSKNTKFPCTERFDPL